MKRVTDKAVAAISATAGFAGLTSAAACCVLPLALASVGVGASGLASLVPLRIPLTVVGLLAVAAGWFLHFQQRRACVVDGSCPRPARSTVVLLSLATSFVAILLIWPSIEPTLMAILE